MCGAIPKKAKPRPESEAGVFSASQARTIRKIAFLVLLAGALAVSESETMAADAAPFDLLGPRVEMKVSRNGKSLPIALVANFEPGDRIWIHPDFPESQSVHYLLVVAFLRGSTNPPPEKWLTQAETWNKKASWSRCPRMRSRCWYFWRRKPAAGLQP